MTRPTRWMLIPFLALVGQLHGQPPAVTPNPQAPTLAMPAPLGMQRGTSLELTLTGSNLAEPTGLWTSFPAKITFPTDANNGKDPGKLRVRLEVPKSAAIGFHAVRLATRRGLSNLRLFCIDDLPQLRETETNHSRATAQSVPIPGVIVGRADPEASDYFKFKTRAGQRVSFEILGRRLGSAFDPQISLIDPRTGRELAYSNDAPGLQTDARLTHTFRDGGEYQIEVRDVMYRGGGDSWYRLRIGDFPCATTPLPMAIQRGTHRQVRFAGPAVDAALSEEVTAPSDQATDVLWVAPRGKSGLHGWPVALGISDLAEVEEHEPNDTPSQATRVSAPCGITGRFQEKADIDHFVFAARKGQRWIIQAQTHEFYSPTEVFMALKTAAGNQLAATNPTAEPRIDFTAPADGDYLLTVEHLTSWGGPEETYRITITPPTPGFDLTLGLDRYDVPQGGVSVIPIQAIARHDYNGPIELTAVGTTGITGQGVIHQANAPAPNAPAGLMFLTAGSDLPPGPGVLRVQARAMIQDKEIISYASVRAVVSQSLAGLAYPPRDLWDQVGVAVTEKTPFTLATKLDHPDCFRGGAAMLTVTADRQKEFTDEIALAPLGLPPRVALALKNIPKGQNEIKLSLMAGPDAPLGPSFFSVTGKAKFQGKEHSVIAYPAKVAMTLPFTLRVKTMPVVLKAGEKARIKVQVVRQGGYRGPINLEVRNLPAMVAANKVVIAPEQNGGEIEITAAAGAIAGEKGDVNVLGAAPAAGNQQNPSANFVLRVVKK